MNPRKPKKRAFAKTEGSRDPDLFAVEMLGFVFS
jgi:hypothetical protein